MPKKNPESVPATVEPFYAAIVSLTDAVCKQHLNDEYAQLARRLAATERTAAPHFRPSPANRVK